MFHSAKLRLTLGYLALIMLVSVTFSVILYRISSDEIDRSIAGQVFVARRIGIPAGFQDQFEEMRQDAVDDAHAKLFFKLLLVNLGMLGVGSYFSYWLAKRTLDPIEEAHKSQGRFTSDAAHELRTPLTAMKTEIEVNLRDKELTVGEARTVLASNIEEINKLEALTGALLRLAKGDEGRPVKLTNFALQPVIKEAWRRHQLAADKENIRLGNNVSKSTKLKADKEQLTELISILFDNAIKYGRSDSQVSVSLERVLDRSVITVTDQGVGIAEEDLGRIFERFYRADQSRNKNVGGYGLGLNLAQQIAKAHGGKIEVSSEVGIGSTFRVTI